MAESPKISTGEIFLFFVVGAGALALIVSIVLHFSSREPAQKLASPPAPAAEIVAIEAPAWWTADGYVRTTEGDLYRYERAGRDFQIEAADAYEEDDSRTCFWSYRRRIESDAGELVSCRQVQVGGEYCAGPWVLYAVDSGGNVWALVRQPFCIFAAVILFLRYLPVSIILAILAAGVVYIARSEA